METKEVVEKLRQEIGTESILSVSHSTDRRVFVEINYLCLMDTISFLKNNGFSHLSAITGLQTDNNLIEILYHMDNRGFLLSVRVVLPEKVNSIQTISDIIPGALLYEREIHDLYGVFFSGHPSLHKLILPDDWNDQSFPLRNIDPT